MMNKMFTQAEIDAKSFNDNERSFIAWASRPVVDRDNEIIKPDAWNLKNFKKNPVILWVHDYGKPPVGRAMWIKTQEDGLLFKPSFADTDMGNEIYQLYKDGILRAFSVGFVPNEWDSGDKEKDEPRRIYSDVELLEISCVPVPSCPEALVAHYQDGNIKTKGLQEAVAAVIPKEATEDDNLEAIETPLGEVKGGWDSEEIEQIDPFERLRDEGLKRAQDGVLSVTTELWNTIMDNMKELRDREQIESPTLEIEEPDDDGLIEYDDDDITMIARQQLEIERKDKLLTKQEEQLTKLRHSMAELKGQLAYITGGSG